MNLPFFLLATALFAASSIAKSISKEGKLINCRSLGLTKRIISFESKMSMAICNVV